jgi:hypothetical protein
MRLSALLFTAILTAAPVCAQQAQPSSTPESPSVTPDGTRHQEPGTGNPAPGTQSLNLPVSLDKIREALQQAAPPLSLRNLDERPTFRMQILERQKIEELLATLTFKTTPAPGGGLYGFEQQRQMFPAVDNPLRQPYAAFNQGELLTILIENLVGKYLAGRAMNAISNAERAHAEAAAREEVRAAVAQYCNAQPNAGAGIQICGAAPR